LRATITAFTTDMWEGYVTAIEAFIAAHADVTACLVIDRFHVAQHYRDDFDELRKSELRSLKKTLPTATYDQDCKGTLWLLRHNQADLDEEEKAHLQRLFAHAPNLHQAYTCREELTALFNTNQTPQQAEVQLEAWIGKVQSLALTCYDSFIQTLRTHWQPILNYFVARITSGFVEGLNNKIKTIKRRCYGIRKVSTLFQRIWLDLQGLDRFFLSTP
jgi:transposase